MKRILVIFVVLVLCVVGVGFYRSWFTVTSPSSDTETNKVNVSVTVDPDKVKEDAEMVKDKAVELTGQATEGADETGDQASDKVKSDDE
jgi:uncharacterized protein YxeA